MGSLSSTPKVPARQAQVVYMPAPRAAIATPAPTPSISAPEKEDVSEAREKTLLARKRGRLGTVATSLRGFLADNKSSTRKTLLGE